MSTDVEKYTNDHDKYETTIYDTTRNIEPVRIEKRDGDFHFMVM
jgi:hypothetical protein